MCGLWFYFDGIRDAVKLGWGIGLYLGNDWKNDLLWDIYVINVIDSSNVTMLAEMQDKKHFTTYRINQYFRKLLL